MNKIPIILASDNNYAPYMSVLMISILKNSQNNSFFDFYLLVPDSFDEENKNKINKDCAFYEKKQINFVNMKNAFSNTKQMISHITEHTYYRLMSADILPENYDKCIYLDIDTIVNFDLSEFYNIDLEDNYVAGVKAPAYHFHEDGNIGYCQKVGIISISQYINAGVILLNLKKIRETNITPVLVEESLMNYPCQDQDVINKVFYNKIKHLPFKYNVMTKYKSIVNPHLDEYKKLCSLFSEDEIKDSIQKPLIIHYADKIKPWNKRTCIFADYWWKYAKESVFYRQIIVNYLKNKIVRIGKDLYPITIEKSETHKIIKFFVFKIKYKRKREYIEYLKTTLEEPIVIGKCPLCGSNCYISDKTYEINELIERWKERCFWVPIPDCYKNKALERRICMQCGMNYYNYSIPDTAEFYEKLGVLHNLYAKNKWDYDEAIKIIQKYKPNRVLDIGCGYGYFIEKIKNAVDYVVGSEFNPVAINMSQSKGIKIYKTNLKEIPEKFDMITAFQVFEHVKDNKTFIEDCINLLNKDGYLLLVTPNPDSALIKYNPGLLELPPHHCCDISKKSFEYIAKNYNLEILEYLQQDMELWGYKIYLKSKYNIEYSDEDLFSKYLAEKNTLIGKSHLVLFKKNT